MKEYPGLNYTIKRSHALKAGVIASMISALSLTGSIKSSDGYTLEQELYELRKARPKDFQKSVEKILTSQNRSPQMLLQIYLIPREMGIPDKELVGIIEEICQCGNFEIIVEGFKACDNQQFYLAFYDAAINATSDLSLIKKMLIILREKYLFLLAFSKSAESHNIVALQIMILGEEKFVIKLLELGSLEQILEEMNLYVIKNHSREQIILSVIKNKKDGWAFFLEKARLTVMNSFDDPKKTELLVLIDEAIRDYENSQEQPGIAAQ